MYMYMYTQVLSKKVFYYMYMYTDYMSFIMFGKAAYEIEDTAPPASWPAHGAINYTDYSTRYRPELDLVLKNLNISIKPSEKVGIVGRTGAGKSSMALSLFRIIEPTSGSIVIDDVDVRSLGMHNLRSKLTIIPQVHKDDVKM